MALLSTEDWYVAEFMNVEDHEIRSAKKLDLQVEKHARRGVLIHRRRKGIVTCPRAELVIFQADRVERPRVRVNADDHLPPVSMVGHSQDGPDDFRQKPSLRSPPRGFEFKARLLIAELK